MCSFSIDELSLVSLLLKHWVCFERNTLEQWRRLHSDLLPVALLHWTELFYRKTEWKKTTKERKQSCTYYGQREREYGIHRVNESERETLKTNKCVLTLCYGDLESSDWEQWRDACAAPEAWILSPVCADTQHPAPGNSSGCLDIPGVNRTKRTTSQMEKKNRLFWWIRGIRDAVVL